MTERRSDIIEARMIAMRDCAQAVQLSRFFKTGPGQYGEGDAFLGIKVPDTRRVVKEQWAGCSLEDVGRLLESEYHELRLCALLILVSMFKHSRKDKALQERIVDFYLGHTAYINNWDLVDLSCYEIVGAWLLDKDRSPLYRLAREGRNIWEQRIAMVSCLAFVRKGETEDCFAIADILLHHSHDLMHKAAGWLLREAGKHDGEALRRFLLPRYASMPRTMLRYAIEKFPEEERRSYLEGRV